MKFKKTITMSEVGLDSYVSVEHFFHIVQDAVTVMFNEMELSNFNMRHKHHAIWVFTKNKATVFNRPFWNEEVIVNCRVVKRTALLCYVKTDVVDKYKRVYFSAVTECCAINYENFSFIKQSEIKFKHKDEDVDTNYDYIDENMENVKTFNVDMTLVDSSRHLNNARAIIPFASSLAKEELENIYKNPFEIGVKYVNQAMLNEEIKMQIIKHENRINFKYLSKDNKIIELGYLKNI